MDKLKKILLFSIPMSICNFRCHYCYLAQRPEHYQGIQPKMKYTPEQVAKALNKERMGGVCYMNFCADGETLLTKDLDLYVKALVEEGHFAEIVTNLTITKVLDKFLSWDKDLLEHVEFKCSFHYLELKKKGLLDVFAEMCVKYGRLELQQISKLPQLMN
jgi:organic radical activating enzyme